MSRVIVKGLPKYYAESDLRGKFVGQSLDPTDVQLRRNAQGESRRFAFVGFRTEEEAEKAVSHFNGTFFDTSKIQVELAKTFVDPTVPKSWKEKSAQRREYLERIEAKVARAQERKDGKRKRVKREKKKVEPESKELKEFMDVMKPAVQQKSWNNGLEANEGGAPGVEDLNVALGVEEKASDNEYEDFGKKHEDDEEEMMPLSKVDVAAPAEQGEDHVSDANDDVSMPDETEKVVDEQASDMDWFMKHRTRIKEGGDDSAQTVESSQPKDVEPAAEAADEVESESESEVELSIEEQQTQKVLETGRLFLRNLNYATKEADFKALFSPYGPLKEVHVALDTRTGKSKGFAYIQFENSRDAANAFIELDKQIFQGRLLHILPAEAKKEHKLDEFELKNMPLKKQKLLKKKHEASKQDFTWNSLYMNTDAVLDSVAAQLGISKQELIDPMNSSSAVKQALAEAHVIGDVRTYFESKGVDLTKFSSRERDDRVILIKNFQHGTSKEDLGELFAQYGVLNRLLMPPAGTIAIVEFQDLASGRAAFNKLSFRRLGKSILYLEKGPKDLFTRDASKDDQLDVPAESRGKAVDANAEELLGTAEPTDEAVADGPTTSVFVKNLNFASTVEDLTNFFKPYTGFLLCVIKTKPNPRGGEPLSMGFGFAEFKTVEQAKVAINGLDGKSLDGHKLQLKISTRVNTPTASKRGSSSKIIVKNLPFEATRNDVFDLFSSFGSLKSVRVPKKFDRSARGFAFVEFATLKEAKTAMDQLQGVHLLGRRLVLDFASLETEDVEDEIEKLTSRAKSTMAHRDMAEIHALNTSKRKLGPEEDEE